MIRNRLSAVLFISVVVFAFGCGTTSPPPTPEVTTPAQVAASTVVPSSGLPLAGDDAVEFLRTAQIAGRLEKDFDSLAITGPMRATLSDGETTARAVFKEVLDGSGISRPCIVERCDQAVAQRQANRGPVAAARADSPARRGARRQPRRIDGRLLTSPAVRNVR